MIHHWQYTETQKQRQQKCISHQVLWPHLQMMLLSISTVLICCSVTCIRFWGAFILQVCILQKLIYFLKLAVSESYDSPHTVNKIVLIHLKLIAFSCFSVEFWQTLTWMFACLGVLIHQSWLSSNYGNARSENVLVLTVWTHETNLLGGHFSRKNSTINKALKELKIYNRIKGGSWRKKPSQS